MEIHGKREKTQGTRRRYLAYSLIGMVSLLAAAVLLPLMTWGGKNGPELAEAAQTRSSAQSRPQDMMLAPDELCMLQGQGTAQMLSVVIKTADGSLAVLDGGWEEDGEYLADVIMQNGGRVGVWLLTHPHSDHAGALYHILQYRKEVQIDHVYESFADPAWYQKVSPEDPGIAGELLTELQSLPEGTLTNSLKKGDQIFLDDVVFTVMNSRYEQKNDPVNNSCIVYQAAIKGKTILFLGDLGYEGGERLLKDCGKEGLKSDIVQMAHHGQNGVGKEVYAAIAPEICLWPTPKWLWDNDNGGGTGSGPWKTLETRKWMEELGVTKHYITKDGTVRLSF